MHKRIYYSNSGTPWSKEEETQLEEEYVNKKLTISEIGDIHKRTPGGIGYQLKRMNIIVTNEDAHGYNKYRTSELYKEIVSNTLENKSKKATEEDYTRVGEVWDPTESAQLIDRYVNQGLSLLEISKIHKRTPTGIAAQLRHLDIVKSRKAIKGYIEIKRFKKETPINIVQPQLYKQDELSRLRDEVSILNTKINFIINKLDTFISSNIVKPHTSISEKNIVNAHISHKN
jgi:hypothetical protein